jgi:pteridine reductase
MVLLSEAPRRKAALVTGAGKRVGAAIALALGDAGFDVALHYRGSSEGARTVSEEIRAAGAEAVLVQGDLSCPAACADVVDQSLAALGRLDLLVSSAANFEPVAFSAVDAASFDRAMALNVRAPLLLAQRAQPALAATRGSIVIITCTSATRPYPGFVPYVISKGAAKQLMKTLAIELAPAIRVNAVAPGTVMAPEEYSETENAALAQKTLVGHLGAPSDIAQAVVYLAGADFITGHELLVDGGVALNGVMTGR